MAFEGTEKLLARTQDFIADHKALYLGSGGAKGHIVPMGHVGLDHMVPTLLLKTIGRKSGKARVTPLIYGVYGPEWVIVASKGGAPDHPAWYLNMADANEVEFQVATQAYAASWRTAEGEERARIWAYMEGIFPPYADYEKASGERVIPLVLLKPLREVAPLAED